MNGSCLSTASTCAGGPERKKNAGTWKAYKTVKYELEAYGEDLGDKTEIVALNKIDALDDSVIEMQREALEEAVGGKVRLVSGVSGKGVTELLREAYGMVRDRKAQIAEEEAEQSGGAGWTP